MTARKKLELEFPLERPHCGVPLSNGNLGSMVWGCRTLNITVNQNDLWDHRMGELIDQRDNYLKLVEFCKIHGCTHELDDLWHRDIETPQRPRRLPVGRFDFHFIGDRKSVV